jgi:hypothetical protein
VARVCATEAAIPHATVGSGSADWHSLGWIAPTVLCISGRAPLPFALGFTLFAVPIISDLLATWIYNSTGGTVLATMLYHHSIHVASIIPVIPGVLGGVIFALVNVAAALGAVFVSRGSLSGIRRTRLADPRFRPLSA